MTSDTGQIPIATLPALIAWLGATVTLGVLGGVGIAAFAGWSDTFAESWAPALLGAAATGLGCLISTALLAPRARRSVENLGQAWLLASSARMLTVPAAGLCIYLATRAEGKTLFASLLISALAALTVEAAWASNAFKRVRTSTSGKGPIGASPA